MRGDIFSNHARVDLRVLAQLHPAKLLRLSAHSQCGCARSLERILRMPFHARIGVTPRGHQTLQQLRMSSHVLVFSQLLAQAAQLFRLHGMHAFLLGRTAQAQHEAADHHAHAQHGDEQKIVLQKVHMEGELGRHKQHIEQHHRQHAADQRSRCTRPKRSQGAG